MRFDRLDAQVQRQRDLPSTHSLADHVQNLDLAVAHAIDRIHGDTGTPRREPLDQVRANGLRHIDAPIEHASDRDQELVGRLVPDNLRGLLRELPSLPSQSAILLGWASELPVLVKMNDLPKSQQPRSDDPEFWGVWIGKDEQGNPISRATEWHSVACDWQVGLAAEGENTGETEQ